MSEEAASWQEESAREPEEQVIDPSQFPKLGDIVPSEENSLDEDKSSQETITSAGTGNMSRRETIEEDGPPLSQDSLEADKPASNHVKQDSTNTNTSTESGSGAKGTPPCKAILRLT